MTKPYLVPEVDGTMVLVTQAEIARYAPNTLRQVKKARRRGFKTHYAYSNAQAKKSGFKNRSDYENARAQARGFKNLYAYRNIQAKKNGFKNRADYLSAQVKKNGFKNFFSYQNAQAQKKGFASVGKQYSAQFNKLSRARLVLTQQMTLPWAGDVKSVYREAQLLTEWEGRVYEVDHLVPLMSPYVSGLHVEANLEVVPVELNRIKSNKVWELMSDVSELDERAVMLLEQAYEAKRQGIEAGKSLKAEAAYLRRLDEIFGTPTVKKKAGIV